MSAGGLTRALAAQAVAGVLARGQTLDTALEAILTRSDGLNARQLADRDRAQVHALAFGALRGHHRHRALLAQLLDRPLKGTDRTLEALLSVGLFQLADPEQPDYAAVSATVDACRLLGQERAAGLLNAALRRYQREAPGLLAKLQADPAAWFSHPAWLLDRLRSDWPDSWQAIATANQRRPPFWLRVNRNRTSITEYRHRLEADLGLQATTLAGFPDALRLESAVPVEKLPGFAAGLVSVQDAASQLAAALLAPERGMRVLDACAAPGGKTTHLLEVVAGEIDLTAVDVSGARLGLIESNLQRLGLRATLVVGDATEPAAWWDGRPFDRILRGRALYRARRDPAPPGHQAAPAGRRCAGARRPAAPAAGTALALAAAGRQAALQHVLCAARGESGPCRGVPGVGNGPAPARNPGPGAAVAAWRAGYRRVLLCFNDYRDHGTGTRLKPPCCCARDSTDVQKNNNRHPGVLAALAVARRDAVGWSPARPGDRTRDSHCQHRPRWRVSGTSPPPLITA